MNRPRKWRCHAHPDGRRLGASVTSPDAPNRVLDASACRTDARKACAASFASYGASPCWTREGSASARLYSVEGEKAKNLSRLASRGYL